MKLKELFESEERSVLTVLGDLTKSKDRNFDFMNLKLTSLEGSPLKVKGNFSCDGNKLVSLKGCPDIIGGNFNVSSDVLQTLEGGPSKVGGNFNCSGSNSLKSFSKSQIDIGGNLYALGLTKMTSLKDIHKCFRKIGNIAYFTDTPIESHVVGLLLINGLKYVKLDNMHVQQIINKHLKADRDVFACIEELEDAGYSEFAKI